MAYYLIEHVCETDVHIRLNNIEWRYSNVTSRDIIVTMTPRRLCRFKYKYSMFNIIRN